MIVGLNTGSQGLPRYHFKVERYEVGSLNIPHGYTFQFFQKKGWIFSRSVKTGSLGPMYPLIYWNFLSISSRLQTNLLQKSSIWNQSLFRALPWLVSLPLLKVAVLAVRGLAGGQVCLVQPHVLLRLLPRQIPRQLPARLLVPAPLQLPVLVQPRLRALRLR